MMFEFDLEINDCTHKQTRMCRFGAACVAVACGYGDTIRDTPQRSDNATKFPSLVQPAQFDCMRFYV